MRKIIRGIIILLCIGLCGCGSLLSQNRKLREGEEAIIAKDKEIKRLKEFLEEKERILKEKDSRIEQLRRQLESVGVFQ